MIELVGWTGNILLAFCAVPAALSALLTKRSPTPWSLLIPWLSGEVLALTYAASSISSPWPLLTNYSVNIVCICVLMLVKHREAGTPLGQALIRGLSEAVEAESTTRPSRHRDEKEQNDG